MEIRNKQVVLTLEEFTNLVNGSKRGGRPRAATATRRRRTRRTKKAATS